MLKGSWACGKGAPTLVPSRPVLLPARTPPVVDECWLTRQNNAPPPSCPDGRVNIAAWVAQGEIFFSGQGQLVGQRVLGLGRDPSTAQLTAAVCQDELTLEYEGADQTPAASQVGQEYAVAAVYYGWRSTSTAAALLGACPQAGATPQG